MECPYIVNKGKKGEHICGVKSKSGPLCAEHRKRKPQMHDRDEEEEEEDEEEGNVDSFMSGLFSRLGFDTRSTREPTPVTDEPTPPRTARSKRSSTSATDTPTSTDRNSTPRRNPRDSTPKSTPQSASTRKLRSPHAGADSTPPTSATDTPTTTDRSSTPRCSSRKSTPKATPQSASTRKLRSPLAGAHSTPPTSTGPSNDGIGELTARLKGLSAGDEDDMDLDLSDADSVISTQSIVSYGPLDPQVRRYDKYLPDLLHHSLYYDVVIKHLSTRLYTKDGPGYVYIFRVTPVTPDKGGAESTDNTEIILKIGSCADISTRHKTLSQKCKHNEYEQLTGWPEIGLIDLSYKAERLIQATLKHWSYEPNCLCDKRHTEFFRVKPENVKVVYKCVKHWAHIINEYKDELWRDASNRTRS